MTSIGRVVLIFAIVQYAFIALDLLTLWREARGGAAPGLRRFGWSSVVFLGGIWLGYFLIQTALMTLVPSVDEAFVWLTRAFDVSARSAEVPRGALGVVLVATYVVAGFWDYLFHTVASACAPHAQDFTHHKGRRAQPLSDAWARFY